MFAPLRRTAPALILASCVAATLAACTPEPTPSATPTETPVATPTATATPTPTPTPTEDDSPGEAVVLSCDELLSAQQVYDFNANFGAIGTVTPPSGSALVDVLDLDGIVCGWSNQTSGDTITVGVAIPSGQALKDAKDAASNLPRAAAFDGYFASTDESAEAQAFVGKYWVVVHFDEPLGEDELAQLVRDATAAVG